MNAGSLFPVYSTRRFARLPRYDSPARRNLITYARVVTALKLEPVYQERAKRHQQESGGAVPSKLTEPPIDTREEIAKVAGVSGGTVHKVKFIRDNPDAVVLRVLHLHAGGPGAFPSPIPFIIVHQNIVRGYAVLYPRAPYKKQNNCKP